MTIFVLTHTFCKYEEDQQMTGKSGRLRSPPRLWVGIAVTVLAPLCWVGPSLAEDQWILRKDAASISQADSAGLASAAKAGPPIKLPEKKKLGLILLSMQSPANFRIVTVAQRLADKFGYQLAVCDPDFDTQRVAQCATSILAQKPDAIFSDAQEPAVLGSALTDAHDMGVPWFAWVVDVSASPDLAQYGVNGSDVGAVYDAWLFDEMAKRKGKDVPHTIMALGAPVLGAALVAEQDQLAADVAATPGVSVVVQHDLDLPNVVQDTLNTTRQTLGQYPDLGGTWTVCDFCVPLIAQVVDADGSAKKNRPVIGGNYLSGQTASLIREGKIDGVVDVAFESSVYVTFDQLLEHWARGRPIDMSASVMPSAYPLPFLKPYILTSQNIGPNGVLPILGADYEDFFAAKWGVEFGVKP